MAMHESGCRADPNVVAQRLQDLGLRFERYDNVRLMSKMAFGMFDTRKSHKCAPVNWLAPQSLMHEALHILSRHQVRAICQTPWLD